MESHEIYNARVNFDVFREIIYKKICSACNKRKYI